MIMADRLRPARAQLAAGTGATTRPIGESPGGSPWGCGIVATPPARPRTIHKPTCHLRKTGSTGFRKQRRRRGAPAWAAAGLAACLRGSKGRKGGVSVRGCKFARMGGLKCTKGGGLLCAVAPVSPHQRRCVRLAAHSPCEFEASAALAGLALPADTRTDSVVDILC